MIGVIEKLVPERGYGFIIGQDGATYFLHVYNLVGRRPISDLSVDQEVSFEPGIYNNKPCARRIEVRDNAAV